MYSYCTADSWLLPLLNECRDVKGCLIYFHQFSDVKPLLAKQPSAHDNFLYLYRQSVSLCFILICHSQILSNSLDTVSVGTI